MYFDSLPRGVGRGGFRGGFIRIDVEIDILGCHGHHGDREVL
jgi:hypothetical protein